MEGAPPSLLEQVEAMLAPNKTVSVRMVLVGRLGAALANKRQLGDHLKEGFEACCEDEWARVSGLLLVYPKFFIQMLEVSDSLTAEVLQLVKREEERGLIEKTKVLAFSETLAPVYPAFGVRVLNISTAQSGEFKTSDPLDVVCAEAAVNMLKIGQHLGAARNFAAALERIHDSIPELLCSQGMLDYFVKSTDLNTLDEVIAREQQPVDVVLDGETVWPLPHRLFPYE